MRKKLFTLRMSNYEMSRLEEFAFKNRMKVSEYARLVLLAGHNFAPANVTPRESVAEVEYETVPVDENCL